MTENSSSTPAGAKDSTRTLTGAALGMALIVIVAWLVMIVWVSMNVDSMEVKWARLLTVLGSVEAVAFAAAGALFGTTVQQQRVSDAQQGQRKAEGEAGAARAQAVASAQAAANGKALAAAVKIRSRARSTQTEGIARIGAKAQGAEAEGDELADLANRLFPD